MSEQGYGVSILNDCKYGFDVKEKKMSITLLKGAMNPDPESDIGVHYFKYSLLPHKGTWKEAGTNEKGLEFNNPLVIVAYKGKNGNLPSKYSFMKIKDRNLSFEAMKKAEDDDSIIIRIVERYGKRTKSKISLFKNIKKASECDLQEKELEVIKLSDGELEFEIKPYEIKTFKIEV
jgi:alpha-mannosidase